MCYTIYISIYLYIYISIYLYIYIIHISDLGPKRPVLDKFANAFAGFEFKDTAAVRTAEFLLHVYICMHMYTYISICVCICASEREREYVCGNIGVNMHIYLT